MDHQKRNSTIELKIVFHLNHQLKAWANVEIWLCHTYLSQRPCILRHCMGYLRWHRIFSTFSKLIWPITGFLWMISITLLYCYSIDIITLINHILISKLVSVFNQQQILFWSFAKFISSFIVQFYNSLVDQMSNLKLTFKSHIDEFFRK
jgi:hypothetical protein